ncbi:hypothetical protein [Pedobacter sp. ASV28]|uniref:hypothetical protein n=1 Tax=Pedobacter sp. ASV28 TaxID=2795123 RepID=UPI0018EC6971|nr:hypothetical protein [Pedobacter sp. ASV28]
MRKVINGINLTTDGCCDHTKFSGSDETHEYFTDLVDEYIIFLYSIIAGKRGDGW